MNKLSLKSSLNEKNNELNVFISWHNRGPLSASDLLELGIDLNLIDESPSPRPDGQLSEDPFVCIIMM